MSLAVAMPHIIQTHYTALMASLLIITATGQVFGTITVAINYYRTGVIAKVIVDTNNPNFLVPFTEKKKLVAIAAQLKRKWWLTLGLVSYVVGAMSGLLAGLIALYH
ncbi:MAG TPA: hypothetical protein VII94_01210 [Candidatus Saccharimonadales bacterium]